MDMIELVGSNAIKPPQEKAISAKCGPTNNRLDILLNKRRKIIIDKGIWLELKKIKNQKGKLIFV